MFGDLDSDIEKEREGQTTPQFPHSASESEIKLYTRKPLRITTIESEEFPQSKSEVSFSFCQKSKEQIPERLE